MGTILPPSPEQPRERSLIAVIDNMPGRRQALVNILKPYFRVIDHADGDRAIAGLRNSRPAAALVAERLPPLGGYEVVKRIRDTAGLEQLPVILVAPNGGKTVQDGQRWCGADRLLVWPCHPSTALMVVSSMCSLHIERSWEALSPMPRLALKQTLSAFNGLTDAIHQGGEVDIGEIGHASASLVAALNDNHCHLILDAVRDHDDYTYVHCLRVSAFLSLFGHITGLPQSEQVLLATGGLLHDVGKINIPYDVLNKPGQLKDVEFALIKTHVQSTVELLQRAPQIRKPIITIASQHHEKLDGSGYPLGLSGTQLDDLARMATIVDIFSALTDRRTYKPAMDPELALNLMLEGMPRELDMRLLAIFRQAMLDAAVFTEPVYG